MRVPAKFFASPKLLHLVVDELQLSTGFTAAVEQLANVATLPGGWAAREGSTGGGGGGTRCCWERALCLGGAVAGAVLLPAPAALACSPAAGIVGASIGMPDIHSGCE